MDIPAKINEEASSHRVVSSLNAIASFGAAATLVGVALGYRELSSYYHIGAPWIVDLVPTGQLLASSIPRIIGLLIPALITYGMLISKNATRRWTIVFQAILFMSALVCWYLSSSRLEAGILNSAHGWALVSNILFGASAGIALADFIADLQGIGVRMSWVENFNYVFPALLWALVVIPADMMKIEATIDIDPQHSKLERVAIKGDEAASWRLVSAIGNSLILVRLDVGASPKFTIVSSTDSTTTILSRHDSSKPSSAASAPK